jgi:tetratricopeptide (TPR) repeat protein
VWTRIVVRRATRAAQEALVHLDAGRHRAAEARFRKALEVLGSRAGRDVAAAGVATRCRVGLGRIQLSAGDPRAALVEFEAAGRLGGDLSESLYWDGCTRAHLGDYPGAERSLTAAFAHRSNADRARIQLAYVRLRIGDEPAAWTLLRRVESEGGLDDGAQLVLAALRLRRGDWAPVVTALSAVQSRTRDGRPAGSDLERMLAYAAEGQGRLREAGTRYGRLLAGGDRDDPLLFRYGMVAFAMGAFNEAVRSWSVLHARYPHRKRLELLVERAYYAAAAAHARAGEFGAAVQAMGSARSLLPVQEYDRVVVELRLHAAAEELRRPAATGRTSARAYLNGAVRLARDDHRPLRYLALLEAAEGSVERAVGTLTRALVSAPDDARLRMALALCRARLDDDVQTEEILAGIVAGGALSDLATRALAAWRIRHRRWSAAADALGGLPSGDPWRNRVLPECLYRAGRVAEVDPEPGTEAALWRAVADLQGGAAGDLDGIVDVAWVAAADGSPGVRAELASALGSTALPRAAERDWTGAGRLLAAREALTDRLARMPLLDATVLILGGQRAQAGRLLARAARADPTDHRLIHLLALTLLHTLAGSGPAGPPEAPDWRRLVAAWCILLHSAAFWESWQTLTGVRYRTPVAAHVENLRGRLREHLQDALHGDAGDGPSRQLLLQRELTAARALEELGGFPVSRAAGRYLVCGPLAVTEFGLEHDFGAFAAAASSDGDSPLREHFSRLGFARAHLDAGRPADAVAALADLRCARCRAAAPAALTDRGLPLTCAEDCPDSDAENPAYAELFDKRRQLAYDAVILWIEALGDLAKAAVTADPVDVAAATRYWQQSVEKAELVDAGEQMGNLIAEMALGRGSVLARHDRHDEAVKLLDAAGPYADRTDRNRLDGSLATILTTRGIRTANAHPDRLTDAAADLRRAVQLNPHLRRARTNLAFALQGLAVVQVRQQRILQAVYLLEEARNVLADGLVDEPANEEWRTAYADALKALELVRRALLFSARGAGGR